jgi:hypothetical protein
MQLPIQMCLKWYKIIVLPSKQMGLQAAATSFQVNHQANYRVLPPSLATAAPPKVTQSSCLDQAKMVLLIFPITLSLLLSVFTSQAVHRIHPGCADIILEVT